ncbi:glycosyltransferase [Microvirga rosea]|uniref:glycosyltransferase n=1 Tax=Microvirga rosea TaxID=2715425 RepID=UPI001D0B0167|nr:glycosyltransferase [Microvirga rosea]MCB8822996.1 glycosyltransferase [Microvirga rosea]
MKILVYPHDMAMGGSQINAIELAAAVKSRGVEVVVFAPDGILVPMIHELGLEYVPTPVNSTYLSARTMVQLANIVRQHRIDLVHAYEWRPILEASFSPHTLYGTPLLMTVLSMDIPKFLPSHLPLIVGTRELGEKIKPREKLYVIEPPIDTAKNSSSDQRKARTRWGFDPHEIVLSIVCRLTTDLGKLEGVLEAIDVVGRLADEIPVRLLVAGDGHGWSEVHDRAEKINCKFGRPLIVLTGTLFDPRDTYDAADIVLGMGSSALKGMSFSKPLLVQGEHGFWLNLNEETATLFLAQGFFGSGGRGGVDLELNLRQLLDDRSSWPRLGQLGRALVEEHFSLESAAERLIGIYDDVISERAGFWPRVPSLLRSAARTMKFRAVMAREALGDIFQKQQISS